VSITAEHREESKRFSCSGCTDREQRRLLIDVGQAVPPLVLSPFVVHGADFTAHLCTDCAIKVVEALSAVITMRDPKGARELRRFFGVGKRKKRISRKAAA
jgi:hypothetical protein